MTDNIQQFSDKSESTLGRGLPFPLDAQTKKIITDVVKVGVGFVNEDGTIPYTGTGDGFKDEDNMSSNSAVATASQQSIVAYIATVIASFLTNIVEDTTPQLGGDLDLNGKNIDFPTTPNISDVLDEDNLVSDSATKLATQQSIKAYVDASVGSNKTVTQVYRLTDDTYAASGGSVFTASSTYVQVKQLTLGADWGTRTLRIKFWIATSAGGTNVFGKIYKNNVAYGTEQSTSDAGGVSFDEDLSFTANDTIEIYARVNGGATAEVKDFIIGGSVTPTVFTVTDTT